MPRTDVKPASVLCIPLAKITRGQFTELPTPPHVTRQVIAMNMHEKQQKGLVFEERNGAELPMKYEEGPRNGSSAAGADIDNISTTNTWGITPTGSSPMMMMMIIPLTILTLKIYQHQRKFPRQSLT